MLKKLRIQNFKCWEDTGIIDMDPITLFFGANSSGKSSIGQFLMMLKQTVEAHDQEAVFYLGEENSVVQLSSYKEMVFQGNLESNIIFEYQWSPNRDSPLTLRNNSEPHESFSGNRLAFRAEVDVPNSKSPIPSIHEFKYELINKDGKSELSFGMKRKKRTYSGQEERYYVVESPFDLKLREGSNPYYFHNDIPFTNLVNFYSFPRNVTGIYKNTENFSTKFHYEHEELFRSLFYLGPLRTKTKRWYPYHTAPKSVGYEGQHTVGAILAAQARNYKIALGTRRPYSFEEFIVLKLKNMGLIEEFEVKQINQQVQMYETKVKTKGSKTWVNLSDIGFGLSQVLPVLVQCFYAPEGSIILIDQPEVHLHPYAQSALADVMIDVIESKLDSGNGLKERNIQLIIETHSEHFLRRLLRRIAEGKLPQDKISAYFANINNEVLLAELVKKENLSERERNLFENADISSANDLVEKSIKELSKEVPSVGEVTAEKWQKVAEKYVYDNPEEKSKLERLKIDEYGNIQNWPENFFGDEMGDVFAQAEAGLKKRMQQQQDTRGLER